MGLLILSETKKSFKVAKKSHNLYIKILCLINKIL